MILRTTNERYKNINQLRFVYRNANDVCILDTFDILIIIMVVLKMLCDQKSMFGQNKLHLTPHMYVTDISSNNPIWSFQSYDMIFFSSVKFAQFALLCSLSAFSHASGLKASVFLWSKMLSAHSPAESRWSTSSCH